MIIGTDMSVKTQGIDEVTDSLLFTFGIKPYSVPYNSTYGIDINATQYTLSDIAHTTCTNTVQNLGISDLSVSSIDITGRSINLSLNYNNTRINQSVQYTLIGN